ncbi:hypothetical protein PYCCODRAFT_1422596 [Trametes coccinea BRFM310]|uniref:Uncharacterized protein n=1 Tax=Trametes coccinea (strain BRFM310) TaxID=1353009 RepID=A0A1Y2IYR8_TRAC3|nr:hypothetical protein PYCCODRAFT_1422596 [Trametes coccinea BRFM310]
MSIVLGTCGSVVASIVLDDNVPLSVISSKFALDHGIPCTAVQGKGCISFTSTASVVVPTPSGWYITATEVSVGYVEGYDVLLGHDWFSACRPIFYGSTVMDPVKQPSSTTYRWERSSVEVCVAAMRSTISFNPRPADDQGGSSSSLGRGSNNGGVDLSSILAGLADHMAYAVHVTVLQSCLSVQSMELLWMVQAI